jgi:RNA polymerase sigma-70 factor, ECF subfamily
MPASPPPAVTEAQLVERALGGNREAFGDLYERHLPAIYRYIFYRTGEATEAEDLTETVFLKAWQAFGTYKPSEVAFIGWLYRIAHNLLVDRYRTKRPEARVNDDERDSAHSSNPEAEALRKESTAHLALAVSQLDPLYQEVLALRFISGLSHAETAQIIGRNEGGVRVIQHRALALLRDLMPGELTDHD